MALQFTPIAFGLMLVVAVGTLAYGIWNMNSSRQQAHSYRDSPKSSFDYGCGYDTRNSGTDEGQRKRKKKDAECCSICLDAMKTDLTTLSCKHVFHAHCITVWLRSNRTCPICRTNSNTSQLKLYNL